MGPGLPPPHSLLLTPPASPHSSLGAPPNTHSGPRTVHASQQDCNRCAQVHRPTGPSLAEIGPHHRPSTQPAFLSRSEARARKLAAHPREPGSQGLLDPGQEGSVSGELPLQLSHSHTHTHTHFFFSIQIALPDPVCSPALNTRRGGLVGGRRSAVLERTATCTFSRQSNS